MKKEILFDEDLRKKWLSGAEKIAKAVGLTLGPCGRYFGLAGYKAPIITKDGVSVAKDIDLIDPAENAGAQAFKESSLKTNEEAGDGTTTTIVLGYEMFKECVKAIEAGCQPIELKRGMDKATDWVIKSIEENTREVKTDEEVERVAIISANNDEKLGKIVANAFKIAGKEGIVHAETTRGVTIETEESKGLSFEGGWASPYFVNNKARMEVNFEDALILLTDKKISLASELEPFLNESVTQKKPLFVICQDLSGEALNFVMINLLAGNIQFAAVPLPGYASTRMNWIEDIETLTGATVITEATGANLGECGPEFLGSAKTVKATKGETTIIGGGGDSETIKKHVETLRKLQENTDNPVDKKAMDKRIARFTGSAVTLKIGAATEIEAREIKDRADDAICAVKAALKGGVSDGAGINYAYWGRKVVVDDATYPTEDMKRGAKIILSALKKPLMQIAENAGINGEVVYDKCFANGVKAYNARTGEYGNAEEMGIIEPTKVQTAALKNANSVVGVMLVTGGANIKVEEEKKDKTEI